MNYTPIQKCTSKSALSTTRVQVGSKPIIAELVANGASMTCRDKNGKQPIDYASHSPELEMILQLLNTNGPAHNLASLSLDASPQ